MSKTSTMMATTTANDDADAIEGIILPDAALAEFTSIYGEMPRAEALADLGITGPEFCDIIAGRRPLRKQILKVMKLRKVLAYERIDSSTNEEAT